MTREQIIQKAKQISLDENATARDHVEFVLELSKEQSKLPADLEEAVEGTVCKDESDVWIELRPDALPNFKDMQPVKLIVKEDVE